MAFKFTQSLVLLGLLVPGAFAQTKDIAIIGAKIEVGDGKVIAVGTIVIHDGKITAVGEGVTAPAGADTVDGKGLVVYPGFIDAYCTQGLKLPDIPSSGTPPRHPKHGAGDNVAQQPPWNPLGRGCSQMPRPCRPPEG